MSLVIDERIDSITTYPRKGTETRTDAASRLPRNITTYPRKGTETGLMDHRHKLTIITTYPRKGTVTACPFYY